MASLHSSQSAPHLHQNFFRAESLSMDPGVIKSSVVGIFMGVLHSLDGCATFIVPHCKDQKVVAPYQIIFCQKKNEKKGP
jgi:hypothetical protein